MAEANHTTRSSRLRDPGSTRWRILFVSASGRIGGAERSLALLIESLADDDIATALVSPAAGAARLVPRHSPVRRFETCSFEPVRCLGPIGAAMLAWRWLCYTSAVLGAVAVFRPRVVHANTTSAMLAAMLPCVMARVPRVWHVRDLVPLGWIGRMCARLASAIIAVSEAVRHDLIKQGLPADKIHVVYNGVDPSFGSGLCRDRAREQLRARLGCPPESFLYVNVGQFAAWKRQDLFLRAAARVASQCERARFLIVGGRPCGDDDRVRSRLHGLVGELGLSARASILDWQEDIASILTGADVLVHTAEAEPFGRVIIEAMQVGLPVIAVRSHGPSEIIQDHSSGLLVEPGDTEGLISAMLRLQHDSSLAAALARAGRQRVRQVFSADTVARSVMNVYHGLRARGIASARKGRRT